uniref:Uncharacterized protein n=1 Tax=Arundo donax TaxID=35708 RepID=A0A0A8YBT3_ARUDO
MVTACAELGCGLPQLWLGRSHGCERRGGPPQASGGAATVGSPEGELRWRRRAGQSCAAAGLGWS